MAKRVQIERIAGMGILAILEQAVSVRIALKRACCDRKGYEELVSLMRLSRLHFSQKPACDPQ